MGKAVAVGSVVVVWAVVGTAVVLARCQQKSVAELLHRQDRALLRSISDAAVAEIERELLRSISDMLVAHDHNPGEEHLRRACLQD
jgi:hypothetical protein